MMKTSVEICLLFLLGCHVIIQTSHGQLNKFVGCKSNGKYLNDLNFCDSIKDCPNGEDEGTGCNHFDCGVARFSCDDNSQCKTIDVRCNTVKDCEDGSDEINCGDEINVENCTAKDKFLCRDGLRCLDIEYTCDGVCNCFDCSEENPNCFERDENLMRKCPNAYYVTANGPQCLCDSSDDQSTTCKNIQTCGDCEQRCMKYKDKKQCSCFEGFHWDRSPSRYRTCKNTVRFEEVVIYATTIGIKLLNVTSKNTSTVQSGIHNCSALSVSNNFVYYATPLPNNRGSIFKSSFTGGKAETIIETDFPVTSIAVDYATNNVYFTGNGAISVCKNDGSICWELKCCGINYVNVAPKFGFMFYHQANYTYAQNSSLLMKSNMDGSKETILADDVYIANITIVVDEPEKQVYFLEMNDVASIIRINRISFDGKIKASVSGMEIRSFGINSGEVFFTLDQKNDIYHSEKFYDFDSFNDNSTFFRDENTSTTKFLYVYNGLLQQSSENPCPKSCSGLCLIKPSVSSFFSLNYTCVCNNLESTSDNRWCSNIPPPAAGHSVLVGFILAFVVLGILGAAGYFMFLKRNYLTLRRW